MLALLAILAVAYVILKVLNTKAKFEEADRERLKAEAEEAEAEQIRADAIDVDVEEE